MTLILGIVCNDGIIMAADSAATDLEAGTKQLSDRKIVHLPKQHCLMGISGDVGLGQKIHNRVEKMHPGFKDVAKFRFELKKEIVEELNAAIKIHAPYPDRLSQTPPAAICIAAGYIEGRPYLIEYEKNGGDTNYAEKELMGFVAIGSGKGLAHALFRPFLAQSRDLSVGKVIAYRVLSDAISVSAHYLAEPIHMYCMTPDGTVQVLSDGEKAQYNTTCALWRRMEFDSLGRALAPQPENSTLVAGEKKDDIPKMEDPPK
jgi:proteasome beta subunit